MNFSEKLLWSILFIDIKDDIEIDNDFIKNCFDEVKIFENKYSRFIKWNLLYNLNKTKSSQLNWELLAMINLSNRVSELTDWYFDITVLPFLENIWYGIEKETLEQNYGYKNIKIIGEEIRLENEVSIDLWAVGKWYVVDTLYKKLDKKYENFIINFWWDIKVKWKHKIYLEDPLDDKKYIWDICLENESISSSSSNKRKTKSWHHLINPKWWKSQNDKLTVFVKHKLGSFSDIFSTAIFVTPLNTSLTLLNKIKWIDALIIWNDWKIYKTKWFNSNLYIKW